MNWVFWVLLIIGLAMMTGALTFAQTGPENIVLWLFGSVCLVMVVLWGIALLQRARGTLTPAYAPESNT
ncbi:MAG TPA: hypothetical protein VGL77_13620 [Armatimonadota bacterium]|jgi:hypothetical protein